MGEEVGLEASRVREGIAQELHTLAAELENNVGDDVILSRVKILAENLGELSAITDTDIPNVVIEKLNECIARLENSTRRRLTERGRPSIDIPVETIEFYLLHRVSAVVIAEIFGVSERTIRRWMEEHSISDAELDVVVRETQATHPNCGYRMMIGHLQSQGMRIQNEGLWYTVA
ncbi:hypothetical protein SKAU_G00060440 [Synaphobranchus kaupii]|uniref:Uncharacterized protein n=1 Tax=Synaphobranchus kaupii TaxID=118154 RepID=A0A9Q1J8J2_SYNKA|nr:hypothetical protein SKAU_G00060440 [Synaphobranchus kaupii]